MRECGDRLPKLMNWITEAKSVYSPKAAGGVGPVVLKKGGRAYAGRDYSEILPSD